MKKRLFSKRWLGNFLIVAFGLVILIITGLVSWRLMFTSASTTANSHYYIGGDYLYIYDNNSIMNAFSSVTYDNPADPFVSKIGTTGNSTPPSRYVYVKIKNVDYVDGWNSENDPTFKLLNSGYNLAKTANDNEDINAIDTAIYNYRQAIFATNTNYRIDSSKNSLYIHNGFESVYANALAVNSTGDADVAISTDFPISNFSGANLWSLSLPVNSTTQYKDPTDQSLALNILNAALSSATNAETQEKALIAEKGAPNVLAKTFFTQDKGIIQQAIANYKKQIVSSSSTGGITISSLDLVDLNGSITINFAANYGKIISGSSNIARFTVAVNSSFIASFTPGNDTNLAGDNQLTWTDHLKTGSFLLGPNSGDPAKKVSTAYPGNKTFTLSAVDQNDNVLASANKNINVIPKTGSQTTTSPTDGNSVPISVTVPLSVDKSNKAIVGSVPIKITASNLNPNHLTNTVGPGRVGKISWYVCAGNQETITQNDSTGCQEKGTFGPFVQNEITADNPKIVNWDASGSDAGTYVIMVKAFSLRANETATTYLPYPNAIPMISSDISLVDNMGNSGSSTNSGDGVHGGSVTPSWATELAANFQKSAITSISGLIDRIGGFSLLIMGILAIIAIIIAGMKYISSGGDSKGAESGKKALLFSIYGIIGATLCVTLIQTTISEVKKIIGGTNAVPGSTSPDTILNSSGFAGPNASVMDIIGNSGTKTGIIWQFIQLAVYYAEVVAVFYILYASFMYITSFGDDSKAESAKKTMIWAVIGVAFILSANVLLAIFGKALV